MPVHNWSSIFSGAFHHFHQTWIIEVCRRLNSGLLPAGYYSAAEQVTGGRSPDVVTLEEESFVSSAASANSASRGGLLVAEVPPRAQYEFECELLTYADKADRIAIRHASENRVVAVIEIVSPGNKHSRRELKSLIDKVYALLDQKIHLLIVDLIPPGSFDPEGLPRALALDSEKVIPATTAAQPLSLSSLKADPWLHGYIELCAVHATLPDMPLFLTPERYINVPLEETYMAAWRGVPEPWKRQIEKSMSSADET